MKRMHKERQWLFFFGIVGIIYLFFLIYVLFLRNIGKDYPGSYIEYLGAMSNFIPLKSLYIFLTTPVMSWSVVVLFMVNSIGNVMLFVPWGFLLPIYSRVFRSLKNLIGMSFIVILLIELFQLFFMLGIFDIEDIFMDILGIVLGFLCYEKFKIC